MALITLRQLLDHAAEHGYGVPAFNVNNLEQTRAIMMAAAETDSPVIMQASAGARKYAGAPFLRSLMEAAVHEWPHIPVCVHQDHGASPAVCQRSIQLGFTSVMMDGSLKEDMKTPASFEYNVDVTSRTVAMAHACGVSVEGELGCLGSLETGAAGEEDGSGARGRFLCSGNGGRCLGDCDWNQSRSLQIHTPTDRRYLSYRSNQRNSSPYSRHTFGYARFLFGTPRLVGCD
jgi:fructose-bisphosphate aldolase class II